MLYIEPLLKACNPRCTFGYADDIVFLRTGKKLAESTEKLAQDLITVKDWGVGNSITFDHAKSELQHFTLSPKPKEYPDLNTRDLNIAPNQATRWLGI